MLNHTFHDPELERMAEMATLLGSEMTIGVLPNPTGAGYYDAASYGNQHVQIPLDSTISGNTPVGTLMEIENYAGPGTGARPTTPLVQPSSTTADNKLLGVLVGGQQTTGGTSTAIAPGALGTICVLGVAQILCDATTTAGQLLIQSAATAGAAKCDASAPAVGQSIGVCLQTVTISSGTALVWALIKLL